MSNECKKENTQCPVCSREIMPYWNYCVKCGSRVNLENPSAERA